MSRKLLAATALGAALLASAPLVLSGSALAASASSPMQADQDLVKTSEQGFDAIRDVHLARVAIFDADTASAAQLVNDAKSHLSAEADDWNAYLRTSSDDNALNDKYVVIDRTVGLAEDFTSSDEKTNAVHRANQHLGRGARHEARDTLRLAGIQITDSELLMPLEATRSHVDKAADLIGQGDFYEANLALKAAEDGLVYDTDMSLAPPSPTSTATN